MKAINLLSNGSTNAKTSKNSIKTFILYLSPYNLNSKKINICPKASEGCAAACLYSAGRGAFSNVQKARQNKTEYYLNDKIGFINNLSNQIIKEYNKAKKGNYKIAFRLNGTSDLDFVYLLQKYASLNITDLKDFALFYDYTAILGKAKKYLKHDNYFVTFSRKENNHDEVDEAIKLGVNVSAVFSDDLPKTYKGVKVIDGDKSDILMTYNKGVILGLKAKGKAKKDNSGFVVNTALPF